MRLDDLRAKTPCIHGSMAVHFVDDDPDQRCEPRHTPVSRAEVLEAALTEPCPVCEGRGWDWKRCADEDLQVDDPVDEYWCRTCEGRGRLPIDGVSMMLHPLAPRHNTVIVPLSMLEGDDT